MATVPRTVILPLVVFVLLGPNAGRAQNPQLLCPPCAAVDLSQSDLDTLPAGALADRTWALGPLGINIDGMGSLAGPTGEPGLGATILQIDTGVTNHPLLRPANAAGSGVDAHAADGLFGVGQTNEDPLLLGFLRFPGHGTKTASVISARPVAPFDGLNGIRGVAPGARLIPVRATQGVLLLPTRVGDLDADQESIARALNEAARGTAGLFGHRIDVISMSLGGWPPVAALCDSVRAATDAGAIVIVAAGNQVRRTKYPAKCPTAIAIAGSTFDQHVWSGSAGSAEVAIAAPAEGVWTASVKGHTYCIEASSGTSFATALVAGMAANWVAVKRRTKMPDSPTDEFRRLLRASARPWSDPHASEWTRLYGPGLADMSRLMALSESR